MVYLKEKKKEMCDPAGMAQWVSISPGTYEVSELLGDGNFVINHWIPCACHSTWHNSSTQYILIYVSTID